MSDKEQSTGITVALARFEMELRSRLALRESRPLRSTGGMGAARRGHRMRRRRLDRHGPRPRAAHRAQRLSRPDADKLVISYRTFVETLACTTFFGTDAGAQWLAEVALVFEWSKWTPSFRLVRERDLRSAAIGARAASRFGPAVIERYVDTLRRARHPLFALDAVVGLTAIGVRHRGECEAPLRSLEKEVAKIPDSAMPAIEVVAVGHAHARRLLSGERSGDGGSLSRCQDAFNLDDRGRMPIFVCLAGAVEKPPSSFVRANTKPKSPKLEKELFFRAWGDYPSLES